MHAGAITQYIDVAQLTLYAFWLFFAGLIYYLHRENKREGYPLDTERNDRVAVQGFPPVPAPKAYVMAHGDTRYLPRSESPQPLLNVGNAQNYSGMPIEPLGNPLIDGLGPAAYAQRPDHVELTWGDGLNKIVPLRIAREVSIAEDDRDPRGMQVYGADKIAVGTVTDAWVDRSDMGLRFLEVALDSTPRTVLVPMNFLTFAHGSEVRVHALRAEHFATIPALANPDQITMLEEEKVLGYFGGGQLYGMPGRMGPLI